jgi:branched-chain amino acid transport system substrate-binding protein
MMELDFQGASKRVKFQPNGDSGSDYVVFKVIEGQLVPFWNPRTGELF